MLSPHHWLSAPRVTYHAAAVPSERLAFTHLRTTVVNQELSRKGATFWGSRCGGGVASYLAWDWVELQPNVICLSDPNAIVSNIDFVSDDGCSPLSFLETVKYLARMVHSLSWQDWVGATLRGAQTFQTVDRHRAVGEQRRDASLPPR